MSRPDVFDDITRVDDEPAVRHLLDRRAEAIARLSAIEGELSAEPATRRGRLAEAVDSYIDGAGGSQVLPAAASADRLVDEAQVLRRALDEIADRLNAARNRATDALIERHNLVERATVARGELAVAVDVALDAINRACLARTRLGQAGLPAEGALSPGGCLQTRNVLAGLRIRLGVTPERRAELERMMFR